MQRFFAVLLLGLAASAQSTPIPPFAGSLFDSFETQTVGAQCATNLFNNGSSLCTGWPDPTGGFVVSGSGHSGSKYFYSGDVWAGLGLNVPVRRIGFWALNSGFNYWITFHSTTGTYWTETLPASGWTWVGWDFAVPVDGVGIDSDCQLGGCWSVDHFEADPWCSPAPIVYCTAKVNSLGCVPAIGSNGAPSASATSGFVVIGSNVRNNKVGQLFYSISGPQAVPYQGGTLCVQSVIKRAPAVMSGGTLPPVNDCSGGYAIDMNAFAAGALGGNPMPAISSAGTVVDCQWWGRDPGSAPYYTTLTDALEYTVCP